MRPDLLDFLLFETGGSPFSKKFYVLASYMADSLWLSVKEVWDPQ